MNNEGKTLFIIILCLVVAGILFMFGKDALINFEKKPEAPVLSDPGDTIFSGTPCGMIWKASPTGPESEVFTLQEATDANFTQNLIDYDQLTGNLKLITAPPLSNNRTYYFRIKAGRRSRWSKRYVWSDWSDPVDILIKHIKAPVISIKGGITQVDSGKKITLKWNPSKAATDYTIEESTDKTFKDSSHISWSKTTGHTSITPPVHKVSLDTLFYYRVRANKNKKPATVWSNPVQLKIRLSSIDLSIKGNVTTVESSESYTLNWTGSPSATDYTIEESTDKTFKDSSRMSWSKTTSRTDVTPPAHEVSEDTIYYYRVRAGKNKKPVTAWSNIVKIQISSSLADKKKTAGTEIKNKPDSKIEKPEKQVTGHWVAQHVFDRERGKNGSSQLTMVLISKNKNKKVRSFFHLRRLENGLENQLIRFTSPADIDGTGFLIIEHPGYETEQLLYLPALRRSRRIATSQKSHRFVNSDFSYEDMERQAVDHYWYTLKGEKKFAGLQCYQLETRPKEGTISQYSLIKSLVDKTSFVPVYAQYFDKDGQHIKTYEVAKLELIQNIWTESMIVMKDLSRDHTTYLKLNHVEYNTKIAEHKISRSALENP